MNRAADWLGQADFDLKAAEDSAAGGHHEWAAFQAQQCAEKAVKALVQSLHGSVRGHSVTEILRQLSVLEGAFDDLTGAIAAAVEVSQPLLNAAQELDKVYVTSRYPNGFASGRPRDYFSEKSSRELIGHARGILEFCRSKIH